MGLHSDNASKIIFRIRSAYSSIGLVSTSRIDLFFLNFLSIAWLIDLVYGFVSASIMASKKRGEHSVDSLLFSF